MTSLTFVRDCLRVRHDPARIDAVRRGAAQQNDHWRSVLALSEAERVGGLLLRALKPLDIAPPAVAAALRESRRIAGVHNLYLLRALAGCLRAFAAATIPVVVLKGVALAHAVYRDFSLRPMSDVDLLVRRDDLPTITALLTQLGYFIDRMEPRPGMVAEHENELAFRKPGTFEMAIDVHWTLFDSPYYQDHIAMDWFWDTAQPASIAEVPTLILGREALLIHLCGHLALHHAENGLLWWHDIVELLATCRDEIDWREVLERTRSYGLALPMRAVLGNVGEDWGVAIPPDVLSALRALPHTRAEERVFEWLRDRARPAGPRFWADLSSMTGWSRRLRFAATQLFPSAAYMRQRYAIRNPLLLPLYYPYRWLRGLRGS